MQVSKEVNKELQRLFLSRVPSIDPFRRILNRTKHISSRRPLPSLFAKYTVLRRMIIYTIHIVKRRRPMHEPPHIIRPSRNGR